MTRLAPALAALALVATACGGGGSSSPDVAGTWVLVDSTTPFGPIAIPIPTDARVDLRFEDGQVGGTAACNQYFGEVAVEGDRISVGGLGQTEMACDEPRMAAESAYLSALATVTTIAREGDGLTLSGDDVELVFTLEPPPEDAPLVGTTWRLDTLITGDAASSVLGDEATLVFTDDGTFAAHTGCRGLDGAWARDGDHVTVTDVGVDTPVCQPDVASQDELVLEVFSDGFTVEVDGPRLTLTAGARGLSYTAEDAEN